MPLSLPAFSSAPAAIQSPSLARLIRSRARVLRLITRLSSAIVTDLADLGLHASPDQPLLAAPPMAANPTASPAGRLPSAVDRAITAEVVRRGRAPYRRSVRRWFRVPDAIRAQVLRALRSGSTIADVAAATGVSAATVQNISSAKRRARAIAAASR